MRTLFYLLIFPFVAPIAWAMRRDVRAREEADRERTDPWYAKEIGYTDDDAGTDVDDPRVN